MRVGDLPTTALRRRLGGAGIRVDTGAFVVQLRTRLAGLADTIGAEYGRYPLVEPPGIADFHIHFTRQLRQFRRRIIASVDGYAPFVPIAEEHAHPLLESVLNWCVSMRTARYLVFHAAVVERDGRAMIMPAPSGSGKNTLSAALMTRGWRLLSDEVTLLRPCDGRVQPNPRPISLKHNAIDRIAAFAREARFSPRYDGTIKGTVAFLRADEASVSRAAERALPALVVRPRYQAGVATHLKPLEKADAFMWLAENSVNYYALMQTGFDTMARLVDACDAYELTYSDLDQGIGAVDRLFRALPATDKAA